MLRVLIDDGAVLQVSQIKHAHRSICSHRRKHIATATRTAECNIIHLKANDKCFYTENATNYTILKNLKHWGEFFLTSLSWAISCVLTWPDTRLTLPRTCPVSKPQIVQVVSILDVPKNTKHTYMKPWPSFEWQTYKCVKHILLFLSDNLAIFLYTTTILNWLLVLYFMLSVLIYVFL